MKRSNDILWSHKAEWYSVAYLLGTGTVFEGIASVQRVQVCCMKISSASWRLLLLCRFAQMSTLLCYMCISHSRQYLPSRSSAILCTGC